LNDVSEKSNPGSKKFFLSILLTSPHEACAVAASGDAVFVGRRFCVTTFFFFFFLNSFFSSGPLPARAIGLLEVGALVQLGLVRRSVGLVLVASTKAASAASAHDLLALPTAGDTEIDAWRGGEAKGKGDLLQIKLVHVENLLEGVRRVRLQVRAVTLAGRSVEVVVFLDEFLELRLIIINKLKKKGVRV